MKKEFEFPEISIYSFLVSDIITGSTDLGDFEGGGDNETDDDF